MYHFVNEDIVVYQGVISRYEIFKILNAPDIEIRQATSIEVMQYYISWNKN